MQRYTCSSSDHTLSLYTCRLSDLIKKMCVYSSNTKTNTFYSLALPTSRTQKNRPAEINRSKIFMFLQRSNHLMYILMHAHQQSEGRSSGLHFVRHLMYRYMLSLGPRVIQCFLFDTHTHTYVCFLSF